MTAPQRDKKLFITSSLLLLVYGCGLAGLLSPLRETFMLATPVNLILSAFLLFINHKEFHSKFFIFCTLTFLAGYLIELAGVSTGMIFGEYIYGGTLGFSVLNVPVLIGLNWLMLVYCAGVICSSLKTNMFFKCLAGASLLVLLDIFLEPVAMKLDFWSWRDDTVPFQNYIAWFLTSFILMALFYRLKIDSNNKAAPVLFLVQLGFFMILSIAL